ncbi:restriction endonuclease subunit S [uncultured Arcobacter sp.]|uniref:restriction endonuclease subunit S n=1 Tax=uncultured Arcobacter sp. TaxID=165434 RepID=UPI002601901D|nr:restriction endonuclease subunit S [uncultured Arcobacter sp.]
MKQGWREETLGEIGKVSMCKRILKKQTNAVSGIPFYKIGTFGKHANAFISEEIYNEFKKKYSFPKKGDILLSASGTIGRRVIYDGEPAYFQDSNIVWIDNDGKKVLNEYLYKFYGFCDWNPSRGATISRLYNDDLRRIKIAFPKIEEQKQIVEILDKAFESIEQAKTNIEKNIQNTKELFQSRLNEIFSQKGDGWEEKKLNQISLNLDNKRIPITKSKRTEGKIPYYGASGIVDYVEDYIFDEDLLLVSEDGANLLARTYPIAFSVSGKCWVNNHAHILKFENKINQKFVEYYLNSIKLDDYISGMAQPKLNQTKLNLIPVPYPNIDIQTILINNIDKLNEQTKQLKEHYKQKLENLEELKKSILQKAFSGELIP